MTTFVVPVLYRDEPRLTIAIERLGHLPVYHYRVTYHDLTVLDGGSLRGPAAGPPPTLKTMAVSLANFLAAAGESLARRFEDSEYWSEYDPAAREFLAATYERLAAWADTTAARRDQ